MRIPRLFVPQDLKVNTCISLAETQAHYLRNVLRCNVGQEIILFNGQGGQYSGVIETLDRNRAAVEIGSFSLIDRESDLVIKLGMAILKRDAMDVAIQKATELGVSEITPLITRFTTVAEKSLKKRKHHWLQVSRTTCEQCERNCPPTLQEVSSVADWIQSVRAELKLVAHPGKGNHFRDITCVPTCVALLIGPEGGLSDDEVELAGANEFESINLGPRILRADTAPLTLISLVQSRWGDL
ncbi:MAG: 16S rRNA (uracil(1498)-N(3))-methyltransferase [Pseudomonadales bacterium]